MNTFRRLLPSMLPAAIIVVAAIAIVCCNAEARDVAGEAAGLVFTFFSTPFVLETSVAVLGLIFLLAYNQRRLEKEQDEWVEMEVEAPEHLAEAATKAPVD